MPWWRSLKIGNCADECGVKQKVPKKIDPSAVDES
jgi:hypothetical protein